MLSKYPVNSFSTKEQAEQYNKIRKNTNPRYSRFNQFHFTAGDKNQFYTNLNYAPIIGQSTVSLETNRFSDKPIIEKLSWEQYKLLTPDCLSNTFEYIFDNYKKGAFVSIRNNNVHCFLPFSNANYENKWHQNIDFNIQDVYKCLRQTSKIQQHSFNSNKVNRYIDKWYANNCLVRYEFPVEEGDSGLQQIADMLIELCRNRSIPDVDFS